MASSMPRKPSFTRALVTGATSGIGKALADFLETKGIEVLRFGSADADLSSRASRKKILDAITEHVPDLIVNSAGIGFYGPALSHSIDEQLSVLEVNGAALIEITLHAGKTLIDQNKKGTILNISSAAAFYPYPTFALYSASKAFVNNVSLSLDAEWAPLGIRVLTSCPGPVTSNFRSRAAKGRSQKKDTAPMSLDEAVHHLWNQIESGKPLVTFNWKVRFVIFLGKFFPRAYRNKRLIEAISSRYKD